MTVLSKSSIRSAGLPSFILLSLPSFLLFFLVLTTAPSARTQQAADPAASNVPVAPFPVAYRRIPLVFWQSLRSESPYSSVMVMVDNSGADPWYDVILRERASGKQIHYCNSQASVSALVEDGEEAYFTSMEINLATGTDSAIRLEFRDNANRDVHLSFASSADEDTAALVNGFIPRPDDFGLVLLQADLTRKVAPSAAMSLNDGQNLAGESGFCAHDVLLVKIQPVTQQWNVVSGPRQLQPGGKWMLRNLNGRQEEITIQSVDGDQMVLHAQNSLGPNSPPTDLHLLRAADQFALQSLQIAGDSTAFQISFEPPLPLIAPKANDKTTVQFTVDAAGRRGVASGSVSAMRGFMDEHLTWTFNAPDWARALKFSTGITTLPGSPVQEPLKKHE